MNSKTILVKSFPHYHISKLKIGFLLPGKREKYLQKRVLVRVWGQTSAAKQPEGEKDSQAIK
ncbi:hypothetical protein BC349_09545 [Flavihumibacter stibioxidans]|uniref:Uncharacterized protein n=1 Tax=Flavihumibacter stibioxidans TaxID=1834163 RepID=A0ABR7M965_9BACT|nr:hypothetical protein [Flavihumibacter stibioxidans]